MSTLSIVNSNINVVDTTRIFRRKYRRNNISTGFAPSRVATQWSLCSFQTTVCTAVDSVSFLMAFAKCNPMQTIKRCLKAIPIMDLIGAVGILPLDTNYAVVKVEQPKFGKV